VRTLLQVGVLSLGLLKNENVGIGVIPEREEIIVGGLRFGGVARESVGASEAEMSERAKWVVGREGFRTGRLQLSGNPSYQALTRLDCNFALIKESEAGPRLQQSQSLLVIHGFPRDKFLCKHIHSAKEGQLEEKSHEIEVPEDQRASLSHPVAYPLEMDWHLGPVEASTVVMAEVVSFVHEVHLIDKGHGISEKIFGTFWVTESVLHPCGDCVDEIHAEKRNQHEHRPNSPIVNKDSSEVSIVARHSP
jgi:hypothetical protein